MSQNPTADTADLLALRQGDDSALDQIMMRWEGPLFAFSWRYVQNVADAQDLVAETFVRLHQQREKLNTDTRLSAWLYTVLTHLCHNHYRWRRRHPSVSLEAPDPNTGLSHADQLPSQAPGPVNDLERNEQLDGLRAAIDRLPHELKTALLLHHYEHLSYREIASITNCSERGVETRLYRAKQRLREDLEQSAAQRAKLHGSLDVRPLHQSS